MLAFAAAVRSRAGPRVFTFAIRSGALLDADADVAGRYHLSPMAGADLRRELIRARQASAREAGEPFDPATLDAATGPVELAGNLIAPAFLAELTTATALNAPPSAPSASKPKPSRPTAKLSGSPLWRRAEPDNDPALAQRVADDIAAWIATCAG